MCSTTAIVYLLTQRCSFAMRLRTDKATQRKGYLILERQGMDHCTPRPRSKRRRKSCVNRFIQRILPWPKFPTASPFPRLFPLSVLPCVSDTPLSICSASRDRNTCLCHASAFDGLHSFHDDPALGALFRIASGSEHWEQETCFCGAPFAHFVQSTYDFSH